MIIYISLSWFSWFTLVVLFHFYIDSCFNTHEIDIFYEIVFFFIFGYPNMLNKKIDFNKLVLSTPLNTIALKYCNYKTFWKTFSVPNCERYQKKKLQSDGMPWLLQILLHWDEESKLWSLAVKMWTKYAFITWKTRWAIKMK